jgi:hypothetical protein
VWDHAIFILLCLASFTECTVHKFHPCHSKDQNSLASRMETILLCAGRRALAPVSIDIPSGFLYSLETSHVTPSVEESEQGEQG